MLCRGRLEAEDAQSVPARGGRLPPLPGRQRHARRAHHVGLDRGRAEAGDMMSTSSLYLTEADVGRLVTVKDAIAALEELFATWGQPSTANLPRTLAVIGTGRQARTQVLAVCAVRPIERVRVFAPTLEHRATFARAMEKELGIEVRPAASAQACVADADVVTTITKSAAPVCRAQWLARG